MKIRPCVSKALKIFQERYVWNYFFRHRYCACVYVSGKLISFSKIFANYRSAYHSVFTIDYNDKLYSRKMISLKTGDFDKSKIIRVRYFYIANLPELFCNLSEPSSNFFHVLV